MDRLAECIWVVITIFLSTILRENIMDFWIWWFAVTALGMIAMPLSAMIFKNFDDRGWMFSKILGVAGTGFFTWWLVSIRIMKFNTLTCLLICALCLAAAVAAWKWCPEVRLNIQKADRELIFLEEIVFILVFLMWTYLAGFNSQAYGTEKFMDYGFMEAMMRNTTLPPRDLWYSEGHINYYYGGQYFAVFLTKIAFREIRVTYNLMRAFVAGVAFALPFSLVYQMVKDHMRNIGKKKRSIIPGLAGFTAGTAVSIAGNMHYVVYCLGTWVRETLQHVSPEERSHYWFPDATRYIGFNPDVPDKTIHEFPCYSFILGDLHAHVVNIIFVLLLLGILYAFTSQKRTEKLKYKDIRSFYIAQLTIPHILIVSLLLGMFQWTNFWDFVIYFVVCGGVVLFTNIIQFEGDIKKIFSVTFLQAIEVVGISYLVILPFTLQFESMVDGVAFAQYHSLPHQLLILWGLPTILFVAFFIYTLLEKLWKTKQKNLYTFMQAISISDLFAVVTGLCAIGLVMIPEIVYVRDIYENGNARANTMFKLTYQAYIMFGITMGYVIYRLFLLNKAWIYKTISGIGLACLVLTCGYFGVAVKSWCGNVGDLSQYKGLDATAYMEYTFVEDVGAINWLKENVKGVEVVLEANGDSYTDYERVSAMTGLPTILGWYVHEWLWRNNTDDLNVKSSDIEKIFTSTEQWEVENLLREYGVAYIFVGAKEREKYAERLNQDLIRNLGEIVYQDEMYDTFIVRVNH